MSNRKCKEFFLTYQKHLYVLLNIPTTISDFFRAVTGSRITDWFIFGHFKKKKLSVNFAYGAGQLVFYSLRV